MLATKIEAASAKPGSLVAVGGIVIGGTTARPTLIILITTLHASIILDCIVVSPVSRTASSLAFPIPAIVCCF